MPKLLTIEEASEQLRIPVSSLRHMRAQNIGPASGKLGRRVFYRAEDIDAWISEQFAKDAR